MSSDRYTKAVLTLIAALMVWQWVKDVATPIVAQEPPPPQRVVIVGLEQPLRGLPVIPIDAAGVALAANGHVRTTVANAQLRVLIANDELRVSLGSSQTDPLPVRIASIMRARGQGAIWEPLPVEVVRGQTLKTPGQ